VPPGGAAADVLLPAFKTPSAFYAQPSQMMKAIHALVINMKAFTAQ